MKLVAHRLADSGYHGGKGKTGDAEPEVKRYQR